MKEDVFVIIRYALAEPKKETGSFEERNFNFNFVAEKGLDNAIEDINNYILSKYCGKEQKDAEVLDKIRSEIDSYCSDNRDRNDGLYIAMRIIGRYKAESEAQDERD